MISRVTLFSFLLGLMLGLGIWMGTSGKHDGCSAYLDGNRSAQSSEYIESGSRLIAVPCDSWIMRQTQRIQILCLVDLCMAVVFVLSALGNLHDWFAFRRRMSLER